MKGTILSLACSLCLQCISFPALGVVGTLEELYRSETFSVLKRLKDAGVDTMACQGENLEICLSPADLAQGLSEVRFKEVDRFNKSALATRWGAFYEPKEKVIYLNRSAEHSRALAGFIGLHELLGALGYPESEFEISMKAYLLLDIAQGKSEHNDASIRFLKHLMEQRANPGKNGDLDLANNQMTSGGGVIVGGAGDSRTLNLRAKVYENLKKIVTLQYEVIFPTIFSKLPIEIHPDPGKAIQYELDSEKMQLERVIVPQNLEDHAVRDIVWLIMSLYPEAFKIKVGTRLICERNGVKLSAGPFPEDLDSLHPEIKKMYEGKIAKAVLSGKPFCAGEQ